MLHPGLRLRSGRYRLLSRVRAGATAQVWRALDTRDGVEVAIKAVPADAGGADAVEHEAEAVARVQHPGVVRVHATFEEAGHGLIVMELAACALADHVEAHGPLDGPTTRGVALALAEVLAAAHAAGVVHRDVKPQNVLVLPDSSVRLADFGIARVHARGHTRTHALLGTLPFMAPEQRRDARDVRPATDVYALAALIAWMRTGAPPGDLFVPEVVDALRGRLRAAGEPDDALLELIVAAGRYSVAERIADGRGLAEALRGVGAREEEGRVGAVCAVQDSGERGGAAGANGGAGIGGFDGVGDTAERAVGPGGAGGAGEREGSDVGSWGGGPRPPATPPAPFATRAGVLGAVALLLAGIFLGTRIPEVKMSGAEASSTEKISNLPHKECETTWRTSSGVYKLGPRETIGVAVDDLDGDGHTDTVFANQLDENLSIYWGDGTQDLSQAETLMVGRVSAGPALGDVNGDGRPDIVVPDADKSELRIFYQTDRRRFRPGPKVEHPDLSSSGSPSLLRWNDDDTLDLLLVAEGGLKVRLGLGDGRFDSTQTQLDVKSFPYAVVRGSGSADAVLISGTNSRLVSSDPTGRPMRRLMWPAAQGTPLTWGQRMFVQIAGRLVELLPNADTCIFAEDVIPLRRITDLDQDGQAEGISFLTCKGCTSNHILVSGT